MKNTSFKIENKIIGNKKIFIIADIGINHGGNFKKCLQMIKAAADAGADSVKIQTNEVSESPQMKKYKIQMKQLGVQKWRNSIKKIKEPENTNKGFGNS